jgi:cobalt/nickel transport protein
MECFVVEHDHESTSESLFFKKMHYPMKGKNMPTQPRCELLLLIVISLLLVLTSSARAHFGMLIPSNDSVEQAAEADLTLNVMFAHPFEGVSMLMEQPVQFGVMRDGKTEDLLGTLKRFDVTLYSDNNAFKAWQADYKIKRPGVHQFYVEPSPYWEPAEDCYIIHYTKVIVSAFGKDAGWDEEIGLKTEIVPLTRPFGVYAGNVVQGIVKLNGEPVPFSEVEIEYYNEDGRFSAPKEALITQVVKADQNGVFTYGIPKSGWWGFAALNEDDQTIKHGDEDKPVELGAVLWIKAHEMK